MWEVRPRQGRETCPADAWPAPFTVAGLRRCLIIFAPRTLILDRRTRTCRAPSLRVVSQRSKNFTSGAEIPFTSSSPIGSVRWRASWGPCEGSRGTRRRRRGAEGPRRTGHQPPLGGGGQAVPTRRAVVLRSRRRPPGWREGPRRKHPRSTPQDALSGLQDQHNSFGPKTLVVTATFHGQAFSRSVRML